MSEIVLVGTCPNMAWSHKRGDRARNKLRAWWKTPVGLTAKRLGFGPRHLRLEVVLGPEDPDPNFPREIREHIVFDSTVDNYMLLKIAHPTWHDLWLVKREHIPRAP